MKKLRSLALYALVPSALALGTGSLLADEHSDQDGSNEQQSSQSDQEVTKSSESADEDVGNEQQSTQSDQEVTESSESADQDAGNEQQSSQGDQEVTESSESADQDAGNEQQSSQGDQEVTISVESDDQDVDDQDVGEAYDGENVDEAATQSSESADQDVGNEQKSTQSDQDAAQSSTMTTQSDQNTGDQPRMQNRGYLDSAPANGTQASDLIGAEVKTINDDDVGEVNDLIIGENGQVVAIVVGVGGFLGMGEKDVAIGWDDITRSGAPDEQELRIDATREDLNSAPKFERRD